MTAPTFGDFASSDDPITGVFSIALRLVFAGGDGNTERLERLSPEARLIYMANNFFGEVTNGGFSQFFTNSTGEHTAEILDCLDALGATESARMLRQHVALFPGGHVPTDRETRFDIWAALEEQPEIDKLSSELDQEFYKDPDNSGDLIEAYIRRHPQAPIAAAGFEDWLPKTSAKNPSFLHWLKSLLTS